MGVYLLTTPGTLLEPLEFFRHVRYVLTHYGLGNHQGYSVTPGWPHLQKVGLYLAGSLFSANLILSLLVAAFSTIGVLDLCRKDRLDALLLLSTPVVYLFCFCSQGVMIARNLLPLTPILAILAARGVVLIWQLHRSAVLRVPLAAFVIVVVGFNAYWQYHCAETVVHRSVGRFGRELADYLERHASARFHVSNKVASALAEHGLELPENTTDDPYAERDKLVLYASEARANASSWPANDPWLTETWFGPREVNYNYYPTWRGDDRILVMSLSKARETQVLDACRELARSQARR
jgi:hypothetical protein